VPSGFLDAERIKSPRRVEPIPRVIREMQDTTPFAMDPVVYNFSIYGRGLLASSPGFHSENACQDGSMEVNVEDTLEELAFSSVSHEAASWLTNAKPERVSSLA